MADDSNAPFTNYLDANWPSVWGAGSEPVTLYMLDDDFVYDWADVLVTDIADLAAHTIGTFDLTDLGTIDFPTDPDDTGYADTATFNADLVSGGGAVTKGLIAAADGHVLGFADSSNGMIDPPVRFSDGDTPALVFQTGMGHNIFVSKSGVGFYVVNTTGGVHLGLAGDLTHYLVDGWSTTWTDADPVAVLLLDRSFEFDPLAGNVANMPDLGDHTIAVFSLATPVATSDDHGDIGTADAPVFGSLNPAGGDVWSMLLAAPDGTILAYSTNVNAHHFEPTDTPTLAYVGDGTTADAVIGKDDNTVYPLALGGGSDLASVFSWDAGNTAPSAFETVAVAVAVAGNFISGPAPTGTIDLLIDGTPVVTGQALTNIPVDVDDPYVSTTDPFDIEFDTEGDHLVTFAYSGDGNYPAADPEDVNGVTYTVGPAVVAPVTVSIVYSGSHAVAVDTDVEVDVTISDPDATGTVDLLIDGVVVANDVPLVGGTATITFQFPDGGLHLLSATYSGDDTHAAGESPLLSFRVLRPVGPRQRVTTRRYTSPGVPAPGPSPSAIVQQAFGMSWKDPFTDVGSGQMAVAYGGDNELLTPKNWVGFVLDDQVNPPIDAATIVIETITDGQIAVGEESALGYQVQGRTHVCEWERMIIGPEEGPMIRPISNTRYFNLSAKDLDESAYTESVIPYTVGGMLASPWGPPMHFPDGFASFTFSRLWERISTSMPDQYDRPGGDNISMFTTLVGLCYVRKHITLENAADVAIYVSCDDYFELWVDNRPMLTGDPEPAANYSNTSERVTHLSEGDHIISFKVQNYDPGFTAGNIAGLACTIFALTSIDEHIGAGDALTHTGLVLADDDVTLINDGFLWLDYPAAPPGFTPGRMVRVWHDEAVDRGCTAWELDFTDTHDSAGNLWSISPEYTFQIGTDGLTMLRQIGETDVDWHAVPGQRKLQMWNKGGKGVDSSDAIILERGIDLTSATYTTKV